MRPQRSTQEGEARNDHALRKNRPRHRRLARHRPRQRAGARQGGRPGARPLRQRRGGGRSSPSSPRSARPAAAPTPSPPISPRRTAHTSWPSRSRAIVGDRLDILVANAGISKAATIEDTTVEDFDRLFAVNVRAPFFLVQQLLPILHEGSSIVLLSSLAARAAVGTLVGLCRDQGRDRHAGEALRLRARRRAASA